MRLPASKLILLVLSAFVMALSVSEAFAQESPNAWGGVSLRVRPRNAALRKGEPFGVAVEIENKSDKPFPLKSLPVMVLRNSGADGASTALASTVKFAPESDFIEKERLLKGEKIEFFVDLTSWQRWRHLDRSEDPEGDLFQVLNYGEYSLTAEIWNVEGVIGNSAQSRISSEPVRVSYRDAKKIDWSGVSITVIPTSTKLIPGEPFPVAVRIENRSKNSFPLDQIPSFILTSGDISKNGVTYPPNKYITSADFGPESDFQTKRHLGKGESLEFVTDLTRLSWDLANSSITTDYGLFELLPKGEYSLTAEVWNAGRNNDDPNGTNLFSKPVKIVYQNDKNIERPRFSEADKASKADVRDSFQKTLSKGGSIKID